MTHTLRAGRSGGTYAGETWLVETEEVSVLPADVSSSPSGFLPQQRVVIMQLRNWKRRETSGEGRWLLGVASVLDPSVPPGAEPGGWHERAPAAPQALSGSGAVTAGASPRGTGSWGLLQGAVWNPLAWQRWLHCAG